MPIEVTDIVFRLSTKAGAAGGTTAAVPADALGRFVSSTGVDLEVPENNLFPDIDGQTSAAGVVRYRCIFVLNNHPTLTWPLVKAWIASQYAGGATAAIGLDPTGNVPISQASAQAAQIANENTAPAGVTFSAPGSYAAGLDIGTLPPEHCRAIWIRKTVVAGAGATDPDGFTLEVSGFTGAS